MREYVAVVLANRSWIAWKNGKPREAGKLSAKAMKRWQKHSPRYPFKWLALMQLVEIESSNENLDAALEFIQILLDPANVMLAGGVEKALKDVVASHAAGDIEKAASCLTTALEYAKKAGYL